MQFKTFCYAYIRTQWPFVIGNLNGNTNGCWRRKRQQQKIWINNNEPIEKQCFNFRSDFIDRVSQFCFDSVFFSVRPYRFGCRSHSLTFAVNIVDMTGFDIENWNHSNGSSMQVSWSFTVFYTINFAFISFYYYYRLNVSRSNGTSIAQSDRDNVRALLRQKNLSPFIQNWW